MAGQGVDFLQEEVNKDVKVITPPSIITAEVWKTSSNLLEEFKDMKKLF